MSAPRIKRQAIDAYRLKKKYFREQLRDPHPVIVIAMQNGAVLAAGLDRAALVEYLQQRGLEQWELFDFQAVL